MLTETGDDIVYDRLRGSQDGPIQAVKTAITTAIRAGVTGTTLSDYEGQQHTIHVDLEYPDKKQHYPGIWVQFSFTDLKTMGMGHVTRRENGDLVQQWSYRGRLTLFIAAFTSLERDQISDLVIGMLSFSRMYNPRVITEHGPLEQPNKLYQQLYENPHIGIVLNADTINPAGQAVTVGVPWDTNALTYEDGYSVEAYGEFQQVTTSEGYYRLERIDVYPEVDERDVPRDSEGWM